MKKDRIMEKSRKILKIAEKYKYILIVVLAGLILLVLPSGNSGDGEEVQAAQGGMQEELFDIEAFENELKAALEKMDGVGKVSVVLTLESGSQRVLAEDSNVSYASGQQGDLTDYNKDNSTVIISQGSGIQEAIVVQRIYPVFRGALIVCEGGGNSAVRLAVTEAVSALTGIGSDRIKVTKMS